MGRERWIRSTILTILFAACTSLIGCSHNADSYSEESISIRFSTGNLTCRSIDPDEDKISDISLWVFDEYGRLEESIWLDKNHGKTCNLSLLVGKKYRFVACANFGYKINVTNICSLMDIRFHLVYPDEYRNGIPMMADTDYINIAKDGVVTLKFVRLMSKISIRMDRSHLSEDVKMNVCGIRIGNCPRSASVFNESRARNSDDCFPLGFSKDGEECNVLNIIESNGISYPISVYMLENIQGQFSDTPISEDSEKAFDDYDPRRETCSYIELDIDYLSSDKASKDGYLK